MASSRSRFLEEHPYAYTSLPKRENHEVLRDDAQADAQTYGKKYKHRYKYAG